MFTWDGENWGTYTRPVPSIEKTVTSAPNAAGWNKATATVGLTATENITNFVLSLKYSATGAGAFAETTTGATASIPIAAEEVTTLTYSASDDEGGASTPATLTIKIDRTPPVLTVPASTTAIIANATSAAGTAVTYPVQAADSLSGAAAPVCAPASGSVFPVGQTTVTCNLSDVAGNAAAAKSFTVIVTSPCLTGTQTGPLKVAAGAGVCVGAGGVVTGPVTVAEGGTLDIKGGIVTGPSRRPAPEPCASAV